MILDLVLMGELRASVAELLGACVVVIFIGVMAIATVSHIVEMFRGPKDEEWPWK